MVSPVVMVSVVEPDDGIDSVEPDGGIDSVEPDDGINSVELWSGVQYYPDELRSTPPRSTLRLRSG
jgi:hypothetical protein